MAFDDFARNGESDSEADVACGKERLLGALGRLERESLAGVAHFHLERCRIAALPRFDAHSNVRVVGIGLKRVEDDLGKCMSKGLVVAGNFPRRDALVERELRDLFPRMIGVRLVKSLSRADRARLFELVEKGAR